MSKCISVYRNQYIDEGCFGAVYRISSRRIVKAYHACFNAKEIVSIIDDEVQGGSLTPFSLPVLGIVDVIAPHRGGHGKWVRRKTKGLVKRYIPYTISHDEAYTFIETKKLSNIWDIKDSNLRRDTRGRIYIIDTQVDPN